MKIWHYNYIGLKKGKVKIPLSDGNPYHYANVEGVDIRLGLIDDRNTYCLTCTYDDLKKLARVVRRGLKRLGGNHENNSKL